MKKEDIVKFTESLQSVFDDDVKLFDKQRSEGRICRRCNPVYKKGHKFSIIDKLLHLKFLFKKTAEENYYLHAYLDKIVPQSKLDLKWYEQVNEETGIIEQKPCIRIYKWKDCSASVSYYETYEEAAAAYEELCVERYKAIKQLVTENKELTEIE